VVSVEKFGLLSPLFFIKCYCHCFAKICSRNRERYEKLKKDVRKIKGEREMRVEKERRLQIRLVHKVHHVHTSMRLHNNP
jgi:hypothetical protein